MSRANVATVWRLDDCNGGSHLTLESDLAQDALGGRDADLMVDARGSNTGPLSARSRRS
ncbi:hypothetical protein [Bradyrhizobium liaoningense]